MGHENTSKISYKFSLYIQLMYFRPSFMINSNSYTHTFIPSEMIIISIPAIITTRKG